VTRVFRVTVRGRFSNLTDDRRRALAAAVDDHDITLSSFTEEGTFTYDKRIDFFNLRYEVRLLDEGVGLDAIACENALAEAVLFLRTMQIDHGELRAQPMDMTAMSARRS
jgi:Family of unknown function (DUF6204)